MKAPYERCDFSLNSQFVSRNASNSLLQIIFQGFIGGVNIDIAIDDVAVTGPQKPSKTWYK